MDDAVQLELLTIGRVSVDLYAEQLGVAIRHVRTFRKSVGRDGDQRGRRRGPPRPSRRGADKGG